MNYFLFDPDIDDIGDLDFAAMKAWFNLVSFYYLSFNTTYSLLSSTESYATFLSFLLHSDTITSYCVDNYNNFDANSYTLNLC